MINWLTPGWLAIVWALIMGQLQAPRINPFNSAKHSAPIVQMAVETQNSS